MKKNSNDNLEIVKLTENDLELDYRDLIEINLRTARYIFAQTMIKRRHELDLDQSALATILNTKKSSISRYENGHVGPTFDKLIEIVNALELNLVLEDKNGKRVILNK